MLTSENGTGSDVEAELDRITTQTNVWGMASPDTTRCAIYLRISLDATGEGLAVARQREECLRIADQRGWHVVAEYTDTASASDRRKIRPGYRDLAAAYQAAEYDALICWDLDRLTRQPRELENWIDAAESRGLLLVTANGEADLGTDGGRMYARIKAAVARSEVERKAARQRSAALQRSQHGRPPTGVRLTGYTPQGETVEEEAEIVRGIFERFAAGDSLRGITAWLAETGVPTRRGGAWHPSSVRGVLTNPRYAGRAIYQGAPTGEQGGWESLVDGDVFDAVQARLQDPRRRTQDGTDRRYLGAGLFVCDACSATVTSFGLRYRCRNACITRSRTGIDRGGARRGPRPARAPGHRGPPHPAGVRARPGGRSGGAEAPCPPRGDRERL